MNRKSFVKSLSGALTIRTVLAVLVIVAVGVVFYLYHRDIWRWFAYYYRHLLEFRKLKLLIASYGPYSAVAFVLLQALQVVAAPIPGEMTGFLGGLLFGTWGGTGLSTVGLILGSVVAFWIGRFFGHRVVRKIVKTEYIEKFDHFVAHKGLYLTFVLFLIPGFPKDSLCYLLGLTRMAYIDFILINLLGRLPGTVILCMEGAAVRSEHYKTFIGLVAGSVALSAVLYLVRNHLIHFSGRWGHAFRRRAMRPENGTSAEATSREANKE
jgi:uncharacterized membrane protein YdjX (TVP38/TMEM64 family)